MVKSKSLEERVKELEDIINKSKFTSFFSNNYSQTDVNKKEIDKLQTRVNILENKLKRMGK